jgi:gluconate 2-dehydrogenase gamma chain
MDDDRNVTRREFMKIAALGAGTLTLCAGSITLIEGCANPSHPARNFLSDDEYHLVEAIAEQIIPTDEWLGGRDAGVANFIDIQLAGPYSRFQQDYRKGLAAIEDSCIRKYHDKFEKLAWETQTGFLRNMELSKLDDNNWKNGFSRKFFELVRSHSLQGYYGSPRHGGNKDFVSYRMMRLDSVQTVGENRYGG